MIILDYPYASEFLKNTAEELQIPILKNEFTAEFKTEKSFRFLEEPHFIAYIEQKGVYTLYSSSENSIGWILENLGFTGLPEKIELFKNKIKFRKLLQRIYPELYFRGIEFEKLDEINVEKIEKPFIIKPVAGFFSLGVHKVCTDKEWTQVLKKIKAEVKEIKAIYPAQVLDLSQFIIEGNIEGEEFAVDAYFNKEGRPIILNILKHIFLSENDVNDRVYFTSKSIMETYSEAIEDLLNEIGKLTELKNFPLHIELRIGKDRRVQPIEVNPMRFAGWCTTDIAYYAYGINTYKYFFEQLQPDWKKILSGKEGKSFCLIILNKSPDLNLKDVEAFNYDKLLSDFKTPLELRKADPTKYGFFGYIFTETKDNDWKEIEKILKSDLKEYLIFKEI
ncbi:MAG: ATP-grasp domain-containing protein [Methanosarcina sp.]